MTDVLVEKGATRGPQSHAWRGAASRESAASGSPANSRATRARLREDCAPTPSPPRMAGIAVPSPGRARPALPER